MTRAALDLRARRVLHVVTDDDRRGAQVFATDLDAELVRRDVRSRVVALTAGASGGLDVEVLGPSRRATPTVRAMHHAMRAADVVVAHGSTTLPVCALAAPGTRAQLVYRQISDSRFWASTRRRRTRVRLALARYDRIIALYDGAGDVLASDFGVPRDRIDVVANGVPGDRFAPASPAERAHARASLGLREDDLVVLAATALVPEKGVDLVVQAAAQAGAMLVIAGDGPERARLAALARQVRARVRFLGAVHDMRSLYRAADVVCLPSRGGDSMPATLIEAALCALPCISTTVGGIPAIVADGRTGLLVAPGDGPALRAALETYRDDRELAMRHGIAAASAARDRFTIDVIADAWCASLNRLAAARGVA